MTARRLRLFVCGRCHGQSYRHWSARRCRYCGGALHRDASAEHYRRATELARQLLELLRERPLSNLAELGALRAALGRFV